MNQQVNLYQPIFRQERKLFSLDTVLLALGIVSIALVAIWGIGLRNVQSLSKAVDELKAQQAAQEHMAQTAGIMLDGGVDPRALQAEVERLSAKLAEHSNALALLQSGAAGTTQGFATRLAALARHGANGVWLDEIILAGSPKDLILRGRSTDAAAIPVYLQSLTGERALSGARFDRLVIDRRKRHDSEDGAGTHNAIGAADDEKDGDQPVVRFSVSSDELARTARGGGA